MKFPQGPIRMSTTPRSYTRIAIAIVIAAVIISASALSYASFEATVTRTTTSTGTNTTTVTTTSIVTCPGVGSTGAGNAFATDCQLGVTLGLTVIPIVVSGQNETVGVLLTNDFTKPSTVNYTGLPSLPHGPVLSSVAADVDVFPVPPICGYPTTPGYVPAYIVVYNASGVPLQLTDSAAAANSCVHSGGNSLAFNASQTITEELNLGGAWTSTDPSQPWINATYGQFAPGNYTAVAFDPWRQLAEVNFSVVEGSTDLTAAQITVPSGASANNALNFEPSAIHVVVGVNNTVTFTNDDKVAAEIESTSWPTNASGFDDLLNPGQSWAVELTTPGVYDYADAFHPIWMSGAISVSPLPLELKLNVSQKVTNPGSATPTYSIQANLSELNTLPAYTTVSAAQNWPAADLSLGPCGTFEFPFGMGLYQGHYTSQNISSGTPLTIYTPDANETSQPRPEDCPAHPQVFGYVFAPQSDNAVVQLTWAGDAGASTYALAYGVSITGYWSGSSSSSAGEFHPLNPGVYTVLAGDEWGTIMMAYVTIQ
jgi:plastocyanin